MKASPRMRTKLSHDQKRSLLVDLMDGGVSGIRLCPVSLSQQRLWFLEQLEPGTAALNLSSGLRLKGELKTESLQRSVAQIVARHETLRTDFLTARGEIFQRISRTAVVEIPTVDLRAVANEARESTAYRMTCEEASRPFALDCGPLLRLKLIRMQEADHILIFTMHHLISDGWSIEVFIEELMRLYEADVQGGPCPLPPIQIQYADYAEWQRDCLTGEESIRQAQYWKRRLAGLEPLLELPSDRVRPAEQSFSGGVLSVPVPASLIQGLKELSQREGTTLFTVLLAALSVLLYRYSQREDICIGIPVAGRRLEETEALIGLFMNTLVIRTELSGNKRFRDLLAKVRDTSLEAYSNQELPFEKIVEELQPKRSLTHNPIFQVMMTALKEPLRGWHAGGLKTSRYLPGSTSSLFDLSVFFIEAADGSFWWRFQYSTALFDSARIRRMIGHYETLLNGILQNPDLRTGDAMLLTSEELEQLSAWNGPAAPYPKKCVHELVAEQVARSPNRIAAVFGNQRVTYAELHQRALRVAAALRAAGAGAGSTVAILLDRSLEMIVGALGVLHSGAAYVPLDPADPPDRLAFKLEEAASSLVLTQGSQVGRLFADSRRHILIEDAMAMPPGNAMESQDPESSAYVIFTSGSTGKPKGVCVPHRALVNLLASMQRRPGLTESDIFLAVTSLSFDISALELFLPLVTGSQLVVAAKKTTVDGSRLLDDIRRNGVTCMQATPSAWRMLIEAGWSRQDGDLKVWCGGETLPVGLADELTKRSSSVWNLYGPTETTVWSSVSCVGESRPVTIGRPICNTQFYVLDRRMRRVPIGVPGELYIGGDGLSKGYIGQAELSRERFVPNPFEAVGRKLYRTGDEVRYREDGEIEYLGRLDFQVKVRGHRIELGEVEYCAGQCPDVKQAVAMVRNDSVGDQRLMCYVVLERSATISPAELRASLKEKLPSFMVPVVVVLESLPLTENGKIDLARLPEPVEEAGVTGEPRNELERKLLDIWKRVLGVDRIRITDNFFDLGGHSLLAMRLLAEIDAVFSQYLPVATVFRAQTVEQMAAILNHRGANTQSSIVTLQPRGAEPPLFLVPGAHHNPLLYADLARCLGFEQPVHLLQYIAFENNQEPLERIAAIAEHFIGEIRKVQPRGPYRLAGFCLGGIVAFEMAQQLIASGEEPPLLALAETWHPASIPLIKGPPFLLRPWIFFGRGLVRHVRTALQFSPREAFQYVWRKSSIIREMILRHDVYRGDRFKRYQDVLMEGTYRAASSYVPAGYPGRISLFYASNLEVEANSDTRLCWRDFAQKGSVVIRIDARDLGELVRTPHVETIAANLAQQMRQSGDSDVNSSVYGLVS